MPNAVKVTFAFVLGAGIGGYSTYLYIKKKYSQKLADEIEELRERYSNQEPDKTDDVSDEQTPNDDTQQRNAELAKNKPDISEYAKILKDSGYHRNYSDVADVVENDAIQFIDPASCGDIPEYDSIELYYFDDGIITDEEYTIITGYRDIIGDFSKHFGEFEDDAVYVKNDVRKAYYIILKREGTYLESAPN